MLSASCCPHCRFSSGVFLSFSAQTAHVVLFCWVDPISCKLNTHSSFFFLMNSPQTSTFGAQSTFPVFSRTRLAYFTFTRSFFPNRMSSFAFNWLLNNFAFSINNLKLIASVFISQRNRNKRKEDRAQTGIKHYTRKNNKFTAIEKFLKNVTKILQDQTGFPLMSQVSLARFCVLRWECCPKH